MKVYESFVVAGHSHRFRTIGKNRFLVRVSQGIAKTREYDALVQEPDLWLRFAELTATEPAIERFADRYGELGMLRKIPGTSPVAYGMEYREIRQEIRAFRDALDAFKELGGGDDLLPARLRQIKNISLKINNKFLDYVTPLLLLNPTRFVVYASHVIPSAWLQLAIRLSEQASWAKCEVCPNLFEIKRQGRYPRKYCSKACQMRDYRRNNR